MFPTSYYRNYYHNWYDRPSPTLGLLDDPFYFRTTSTTLPYYMRPRRLSNFDNGDTETSRTQTSETVTTKPAVSTTVTLPPNVADEKTATAEVSNQKDKFTVSVDVSHFAPHEIQVKVSDNSLVIEANHDEKMDEHGAFVTRSFKRRYELPPDTNAVGVVSDLNNDGILTITAPKLHMEPPKERVIPVQFSNTTNQLKSILKRKN